MSLDLRVGTLLRSAKSRCGVLLLSLSTKKLVDNPQLRLTVHTKTINKRNHKQIKRNKTKENFSNKLPYKTQNGQRT